MESVPEEERGQDLEERNTTETERSGLMSGPNFTPNMMNIASNTLSVVFVVFMIFVCFFDGVQLFSFHPPLMAIGWLLFMTSAINSLSPGDGATQWIPIQSRPTKHWVLQAIALTCITLGFIVIVTNKLINHKDHFKTYHSCFGLTAYFLLIITSCGGIFALYSLQLRKVIAPVYLKIGHAILGILTFSIGTFVMALGLFSSWWNHGDLERYFCLLLLTFVFSTTVARPCVKTFVRIKERWTHIRSST